MVLFLTLDLGRKNLYDPELPYMPIFKHVSLSMQKGRFLKILARGALVAMSENKCGIFAATPKKRWIAGNVDNF